ncbi:heme exporter protein CcmB [Alkalilimnicola sp. S0819]|nr:heme exporter protein CcmB [Alkalilimnicola sp. S0819]KAB7627493.1 heme exporter protein CcmB [Alkalilimnicola sp. S0819]MPQ15646.1 heme exporter protein CcmB [Alkalilimnicola sp. S0819]
MIDSFLALLRRDLQLALRDKGELANPLIFFLIIISLFPLALGAGPQLLQSIAPGVLWVAALLVSLLSLDPIFRSDYEDGSLEQLLLSPQPLSLLVLAKILAHWLVTGLPLALASPLLAMMLRLPSEAWRVLLLSLLLGTPVLSALGAIGVALTVGLRRGGVLLSLLILPLYVPLLIFAAGAVDAAAAGIDVSGQLYLLAAMALASLALAPLAVAAGLRISLD